MPPRVLSVNISAEKGTSKQPVPEVRVGEQGIVGDAHAGRWHRQVTLLARERMDAFATRTGRSYRNGEFAENITTVGIDLAQVGLRERLCVGEVELEVTQIGKKCHGAGCAIYREVGACLMPQEGIFCRVVRRGVIRTGDAIEHVAVPLRLLIVTVSDRASRGEYEDRSGPAIHAALEQYLAPRRWKLEIVSAMIPDDAARLRAELERAFATACDVVFTTGGTGVGPHDITPDVVRPLLDKEIPGIVEHIRLKYGASNPAALLSRSVAGVKGQTLVYCVPGSVTAATEYLAEILKTLEHCLEMLWGLDTHLGPS